MIKKFYYSPRFERSLRNFPKRIRLEIVEKLRLIAEDPSLPHFRVHKLQKNLTGWLSASVAPDIRVIFKFTKTDRSEALLYDIGSHEVYK